MGGRNTTEWYPQARAMREAGAKVSEICEALNRGEGAVNRAIKGVACPIDHVAESYRRRRSPEWVPRARELRRLGSTYLEIAHACGTHKATVIKHCRDIPFDGRIDRKRDPSVVARAVEKRRENRAKAIADGTIVLAPKKARQRIYRPKAYKPPKEELLRRTVRRAVVRGMQDRKAPITLPKLRFLEGL